jgi:hypothetical protein
MVIWVDSLHRRRLIITRWLVFAVIYLGFALARAGQQVWLLYVWYGLYYGMAYRTIIAKVADLVLETLSGVTLGTFNPAIDLFGISDLG